MPVMVTVCLKCLHDHLCYCGVDEGEDLGFCCECDTDDKTKETCCGPWASLESAQLAETEPS